MWSFKHNKLQLWSENVSCYLISKVKTYLFQNCPECPRNNKSPRLTWVFNVYSTWDIHITLVQACNLTFVNMKSIMLPSPYLTPCGHWLPRNIQRAHYTKNNITFQHVCYYAHFWTDIKNAFATQFSTRLEYWNFNRGPSKLDAPIHSKQFFGLKFCFG